MGCFGINDILKDKIIWPECVYSVDAHFSFRSSSFLVKEALLPPEFGERLAGEPRDIDMDSAFWVNMWVMPSVFSNLEWGEVFPDEGSGFRPVLRSADEDVW